MSLSLPAGRSQKSSCFTRWDLTTTRFAARPRIQPGQEIKQGGLNQKGSRQLEDGAKACAIHSACVGGALKCRSTTKGSLQRETRNYRKIETARIALQQTFPPNLWGATTTAHIIF